MRTRFSTANADFQCGTDPRRASRCWRSINRHSNSSSFELLELAEEMGLTDCQLTTDYDLLLDDYGLKSDQYSLAESLIVHHKFRFDEVL